MYEPRNRSSRTALSALTAGITMALCAAAHAQPETAPSETQGTTVVAPPPAAPSAAPPPADVSAPLPGALARWGCLPSHVLQHEGRWYAACGAAGVLIAEHAGDEIVLRERRHAGGSVQALFLRGEEIWVETRHLEAHPLSELAASAGESTTQVAMAAQQPISVEATRQTTPSLLAPPRIGRLWSVEGSLRPYLPLQSLGVALLASGALSYRGERNWYAQLQLMPLGGTATKGRDQGLLGGAVSGGYDHQFFALGLGMGTLRRGQQHDDYDQARDVAHSWVEHSYGFSVNQHARLGALDGLNFMLTNAFVLDDQRWRFGFFDLSIQVPLNRQTWLTAAGGGGEQAGYFFGEVGLRRLIRGDRGGGSLFVKPSVGIAGIDNRHDYKMVTGPMIGCHLEWRADGGSSR